MLKINLSDKEGKKKEAKADETAVNQSTEEITEQKVSEELVEGSKKSSKLYLYLVIVLGIAVIVVGYLQKDRLLSLLPGKEEVVEVVTPPPAPPPESVVVPKEPDPTFVVLNSISEMLPPRVWITGAILSYDGTYDINGIAFSHEAMGGFTDALGSLGEVTIQNIPGKSKSSETVYNFSLSGAITVQNVPEILDVIPTDNLITLADPVVNRSEEFGVTFSKIPQSGQTYSDRNLPFALDGSYVGLKKMIAELCPAEGDLRIYRIVIVPSAPGKSFDNINASFSLRTISSI